MRLARMGLGPLNVDRPSSGNGPLSGTGRSTRSKGGMTVDFQQVAGEMVFVHETVARVNAQGRSDDSIRLLMVLKALQDGPRLLNGGDAPGARELFQRALAELEPIRNVDTLRALVKASLAAACLHMNRLDEAISLGREALDKLATDPRLAARHARCLDHVGCALVNSGQVSEGIKYLEKALVAYRRLPGAAETAEICRTNLDNARAAIGQSRVMSWLSRIFGD